MTNEIANVNQRELTDTILTRVNNMKQEGLTIPDNYSPANALNIAYLQLEESGIVKKVSPESLTKSLLNMVIQGLSPAKTQCYFIPYGNTLNMQRSYFGTQMAVKRLYNVDDIWANVIFEDDDFDMEIDEKGVERFIKHDTNWKNRDGEIVGAYAIIETTDRGKLLTVMTRKEIEASWSQAKTKNVQNKFPQEMAKRTVINRAAKAILNTSDDSDHLINAINATTENEYDEEVRRRDVTEPADEEKAQDLLNEFKATTVKDDSETPSEVEEPQGFTQEQIDELNAFSNEQSQEDNQPLGNTDALDAEFEVVEETTEIDFSKLTMDDIKKMLDDEKVTYKASANRDELVAVAEMALNGGVLQDDLF